MRRVQKTYDIIVVGGGHAGTEAAAAAARIGASVALVSFSREQIGAMSCNPAMGGLGKGHLIREVDAFDGLIARASDHAAIHYRMLNASKGAAVRGPRVQADRRRYRQAIHDLVDAQAGLVIVEGEASALAPRGPPDHRPHAWRRAGAQRQGGDPRHRHLPRRQASFRHEQLCRRPGRRTGGDGAGAAALRASICRSPGSRPERRRGSTGGRSTGRGSSVSRRTRTAGRCRR